MSNLQKPPFLLRSLIQAFLIAQRFGLTKIPKVRGLFFYIYSKMPNKRGVFAVPVENGRLYVDLADHPIPLKILKYGVWERGLTELVKKIVRPGMTVVDAGAHVGYYTLLFSKLVGSSGKVIAFEPAPNSRKILEINVRANGLDNCIIEDKAVSDSIGQARLYLNKRNFGRHSIISYSDDLESIEVKTVKLDDYFTSNNKTIDIIKIDVEGNEVKVLSGCRELVRRCPNISIIAEFNGFLFNRSSNDSEGLIKLIQELGLSISIIDSMTGDLTPVADCGKIAEICGDGLVNLLCKKQS